jgi:hypothetical protein
MIMIITITLVYLFSGSVIWALFDGPHIAVRCRSRTDRAIATAMMIVTGPPMLAWRVVIEMRAWVMGPQS